MARIASRALAGLIGDGQQLTLTMMQWLSETRRPWTINSEVGDLHGEILGGIPLLTYERYNVILEEAALQADGEAPAARNLRRLRDMTSVASMDENYAIAMRAAGRQVTPDCLPPQFELDRPPEGAADGRS